MGSGSGSGILSLGENQGCNCGSGYGLAGIWVAAPKFRPSRSLSGDLDTVLDTLKHALA